VIWTGQSLLSMSAEPDADMAGALLGQWSDADW
jgi:hypothetical protein